MKCVDATLSYLLSEEELIAIVDGFCDEMRGNNEFVVLNDYGTNCMEVLNKRIQKKIADEHRYMESYWVDNASAIRTENGVIVHRLREDLKDAPIEMKYKNIDDLYVTFRYSTKLMDTNQTIVDDTTVGPPMTLRLRDMDIGMKEAMKKLRVGDIALVIMPYALLNRGNLDSPKR
jgi:hypothetical protein